MNIALQKQFLSLNQNLREKGCPITARYRFFIHFYYCLINDKKLLLKICTSSHISGSDLWQKLSELFMYTAIDPRERMTGAPEVSYYKRFMGVSLIPIVFDAETRSLIISLAQKYYEPVNYKGLDDPYVIFSKNLVMRGSVK